MRFLSNSILPYSEKHGLHPLILIFIFLSPPLCTAQYNSNASNNNFYGAQFSSFMAVIILVLIAALLFMVFLLIFIRNCANPESNRSIRPSAIGGEVSRRGARGIDASVIDNFPTMVYSEVKDHKIGKNALECAVCLSEFEDNETLRLLPICDHVFHPECIDEWLGSHTTCPVCRVNLSPQLDDLVAQPIEFSTVESDIEAQHDAVVSEPEDEHEERPLADEAQSVGEVNDANRKRGSRSGRTRKFPRSHSTGHSLVQPGENMDRFTLRLPVEVRKQMVNRQLNRATSLLILPREGSSRRGYRRTNGEGSSRGGRYSRRIEKLDRFGKSDRWVYGRAPSFFSRAFSMKSPKVVTNRGEEAPGPVADSVRPPV